LCALAQSYLVVDASVQSEAALAPIAATAPYAVLVGGQMAAKSLAALSGQLSSAGFAR
jgi:hypothetical protein